PPHPGELEGDAALHGDGAAGETGAGAARDDRHPVLGGRLDDRGHLLGVDGEHDHVGQGTADAAVPLEDDQVVPAGDDVLAAGDAFEVAEERFRGGHVYARGASRSGLRSKASKRRVPEPGIPGASMNTPSGRSWSSQGRTSSSPGTRSSRSKTTSQIRPCGETWIVYQTPRPSGVTAWWVSSTRRLTGSLS